MNINRLAAVILAVAGAAFLVGCDSVAPLTPGPSAATHAATAPPYAGGMRLQAGDRIKVTVFGEDKLSGDFEIDPAGAVSLPLAGTVTAAGLSKSELEQLLTKKYSADKYLRNPKVTVDVASFRPFYVLGEVEKPGEYPYKSGLNVVSALAVAGGNTYRASQSRVMIQRAGDTGFRDYPLSPNIPVYPGDLIRVPERYF